MEVQYFLRYPVPRVETFVGTLDEVYGTGCYDVELVLVWEKAGDSYTLRRRIRTADVFWSEKCWEERPREEGVFLFDLVRADYEREAVEPPVDLQRLKEIARERCAQNPRILPEQFSFVRWPGHPMGIDYGNELLFLVDKDLCEMRHKFTGVPPPPNRVLALDETYEVVCKIHKAA
jgi:hypothetical protein